MKEFSKKLLFADYLIAILLILGFFICVTLNGAYTKEIYNTIINSGLDISYSSIPQLYNLDGFGILLGTWIIQLGLSSGAYYMMSKSDHKIQLPMAMLNTMPDEIKSQLDLNQVITTVLSTTDN
ncbi:hypothetical protein AALB52_18295 [Lachnospiraceae bacterium 38-14]